LCATAAHSRSSSASCRRRRFRRYCHPEGKKSRLRAFSLAPISIEQLERDRRHDEEVIAAMPSAWLRRNVFHPCVEGPLLRAIYLATPVWPMLMPSLRSSPWRRGAPQKRVGDAHLAISRRISHGTVSRPQRCRDFQRQYNLKPARRQRITVSGFTIVNALMVFGAKRYSPTKIKRSMTLKASLFGWCRRWTLS
jgi:hypothetical protein